MLRRLWKLILKLYRLLLRLIQLLTSPFGWLKEKLDGIVAIKPAQWIPDGWNITFSVFNGFLPFALLVCALLFVVAVGIFPLGSAPPLSVYVEELFFTSTTIGAGVSYMAGEMDMEISTMLAIALPGYLVSFCMSTLNRDAVDPVTLQHRQIRPKRYIRIPAYVIYTAAAASAALLLCQAFDAVGGWISHTLNTLWEGESGGFFSTAFSVIGLAVMSYIVLLLGLIAIKEYAEALVFCGFYLIISALLYMMISEGMGVESDTFWTILNVSVILLTDLLRNHCVGILERQNEIESKKGKWKKLPGGTR